MKIFTLNEQQKNKITLLRHAAMPKGVALDEASVALEFTSVELPKDIKVKARSVRNDENGHEVRHFEFEETPFVVRYRLIANYDPANDIDVAGNLGVRDDDPDSGLDEEKDAWLEQARNERTELYKTENGQELMKQYNAHNDTYSLAFDSPAFCNLWKAGGVVQKMSRDTYAAMQSDEYINDKTYTDIEGKTVSYNNYSFWMQEQLDMALQLMKGHTQLYRPGINQIADDEIDKAIAASRAFANAVSQRAKISKDSDKKMTKKEVYGVVNEPADGLAFEDFVSEEVDHCGYYAERLEREKRGETLEDDQYGYESFYRSMVKEIEEKLADGTVLYEGAITGLISDTRFEVDIAVKKADGEVKDVTVARSDLSEVDFDIDSEKWDVEYRDKLEAKLQEVSFVSQSLSIVLKSGIGQIVRKEVAKYEAIHK